MFSSSNLLNFVKFIDNLAMVTCAVVGCCHRTNSDRADNKKGVRFFCIPSVITRECDTTRQRSEKRRAAWIARIKRKDLQEADIKPYTRVCSRHFISGAPSNLWETNNPDWAPSQNLGYRLNIAANSQRRYECFQRIASKKSSELNIACREKCEVLGEAMQVQPHEEHPDPCAEKSQVGEADFSELCSESESHSSNSRTDMAITDQPNHLPQLGTLKEQNNDPSEKYGNVLKRNQKLRDEVTDLEVDKLELQTALQAAKAESEALREKVQETEENFKKCLKEKEEKIQLCKESEEKLKQCMNEVENFKQVVKEAEEKTFSNLDTFSGNEAKVRFYTGLPSYAVFTVVLNGVNSFLIQQNVDVLRCALKPWQSLLLTLMRLRLALTLQDLAFRFGISKTTACRIFEKYIDAMYKSVYPVMVTWPDRETLWETMPREFRECYGNSVAVIIDCSEVFTEKPSSLETRAMVWSNYKHHHTVKILVGISPTGAIIFVSTAWGARTSDQRLVSQSGLYELLLPHDVVMADRGFRISEDLAMYGAKLLIPAFTRGQDQLSSHDITLTRKIANLRIHIERVIGLLRRKYRILKSILPVEMLTKRQGEEFAPIDKIVRVCCALVNMCPSIVVHPDIHEDTD